MHVLFSIVINIKNKKKLYANNTIEINFKIYLSIPKQNYYQNVTFHYIYEHTYNINFLGLKIPVLNIFRISNAIDH